MCLSALLECISVDHLHTWYLRKSEEGVLGATIWVLGTEIGSSGKTRFQLLSHLSSLRDYILK